MKAQNLVNRHMKNAQDDSPFGKDKAIMGVNSLYGLLYKNEK